MPTSRTSWPRSSPTAGPPSRCATTSGCCTRCSPYAERQEWTRGNPCKLVEKPCEDDGDADIRFLDENELEALLRAVPGAGLGPLDRVLYLTAAMTGLRQGELLALRWRDIDWAASRVRVRQNYVRGEFGRPKSKRSSRSVPLADHVAGELDRHFKSSLFQADDHLVFCNPHTGKPLARRAVLKRFKKISLARAFARCASRWDSGRPGRGSLIAPVSYCLPPTRWLRRRAPVYLWTRTTSSRQTETY